MKAPERFADHAELDAFAKATGCEYFWQGTSGLAKHLSGALQHGFAAPPACAVLPGKRPLA
jgi:hypothetical protein